MTSAEPVTGLNLATPPAKLKEKPRLGGMLLNVARRLVHPGHLAQLARRTHSRESDRKAAHDAELKFCAKVLSGDFLNYGYYEDPTLPPEKISLHAIQQAQVAYGNLLIDLVADRERPVLDAGCGMGGLLNLMVARGLHPVALTPNHSQIEHIRGRHPDIPMIEGRFELATLREHGQRFGTVVTSESFQYIKLIPGLQALAHVLAPGGRWVLCDYFRITRTQRRSGHQWIDFSDALAKNGWTILSQRDVTENVLPTLRYLHMLADRVGGAASDFAEEKLRRKHPALHYLIENVLAEWRSYFADQIRTVDPDVFVREKKYMLMVMERTR